MRTLGQATELQRAGGGTGYAFSHLRPAGDRCSGRHGGQRPPFLRLYDSAAGVVSMAVAGVAPVWLCLMCRTWISVISSPPRPNPPASFVSTYRLRDRTRSCTSNATGLHRLVNPRTGKIVARMPAAELFDAICKPRTPVAIPGWCSSTRSLGQTRCRGEGPHEATNLRGEVPLLPYES